MGNRGIFKKLPLLVGLISVVGCGGGEPAFEAKPVASTGYGLVWSEFLSESQVDVALPTLARHGLSVGLAWPAAEGESAERFALVRRARKAGVEVRPWLLLSDSDGYWPGSTNAVAFSNAAEELMDAWEAADLVPGTLIVDMEMRKDRALQMSGMLAADNPDLGAFVKFLADGMNPDQYASATATYAALVSSAHARGWRVHLTTLPQVLDDYADDDDDVRQAFGIPLEGADWDLLTFQAYRTLFGGLLSKGQIPSSYFVYAYGVDAKSRFGERAGLDIGMVGQGVSESPTYTDGAELAEDVAAALAAGIPPGQLDVYNLDGILARIPEAQWLGRAPEAPEEPEPDAVTASIRKQSQLLDAVLAQ